MQHQQQEAGAGRADRSASRAPAADGSQGVGRGIRLAIVLMFVASGAAGLIYEIVWFRLLTYLFGATLPAVSTVLASFMAGLALGSWILGRRADFIRRPLRLYAKLEVGVAVLALLVPWLIYVVEAASRATFGDLSFSQRSVARLFFNLLVLLGPTTLMGATLPALSRFTARGRESLGLDIGGLYAANTTGAVLGAFVAGFVLIETLGVAGTQYAAAGLNLLAAFLAWRLDRQLGSAAEVAPSANAPAQAPASLGHAAPAPARPPFEILLTYGLSGCVAMSFQVAWTRGLLFCAEGTTYTLSAMLTVFLAGLALGSALMTRLVDRHPHPRRLYALLLLVIGASGGLSGLILFHVAPWWSLVPVRLAGDSALLIFLLASLNRVARIVIVMGLPTFAMGLAFPVAARLCVTDLRRVSANVGLLYASNTIGAIIGSASAGFLLIPALGLSRAIFALSSVSILSAIVLFVTDRQTRPPSRAFIASISAALIFALGLYLARTPLTFSNYLQEDLAYRVLAFVEGPLDTVTVTENVLGTRKIAVDNVAVAGTDRVMLTDQKSLAHLPALILPNPKSVLTVGFGSGGASHSYTLYQELSTVHCVEISPTILKPDIQRLLEASNRGLIDRMPALPQFSVVRDDVRSYLRFARQRYDSIAVDCTDLRYKANANLYDLEFFQLCRDRLTDQGMVVVWMPLGDLDPVLFRTSLRTFASVFPGNMHVWYINNGLVHYCLLAGFVQPLKIDYGAVASRFARPAVAADLKEILLDHPDRFLGCYVTGGKPLQDFLYNTDATPSRPGHRLPLNTEDRPVIEFQAPRVHVTTGLAWDNLQLLYAHRQSVLEVIDAATLPSEAAARITRFEAAAPHIARGLAALNTEEGDNLAAATRQFQRARHIAPDDTIIDELQRFPFHRDLLRATPTDLQLAFDLGLGEWTNAILRPAEEAAPHYRLALEYFSVLLRGLPAEAELAKAEEGLRNIAASAAAHSVRCHYRLGQAKEARAMLDITLRLFPKHPHVLRAVQELALPATHPAPAIPDDTP